MQETILLFDGSFEGLLSAIFEVYAHKLEQVFIQHQDDKQQHLFANMFEVVTDKERATRVAKKLKSIIGQHGLDQLSKSLLSEDATMPTTILRLAQYAIDLEENVFHDYSNKDVIKLTSTLKLLSRERHRMTAFIRFQEATDGIYYAVIEPDFDVLPLISTHFKNRYPSQKWLIFDTKRSYGLFYDLSTVEYVRLQTNKTKSKADVSLSISLTDEENIYQQLWRTYFKHTNIKSRKNMKLHLQHVPKRYWRYLIEKQGG